MKFSTARPSYALSHIKGSRQQKKVAVDTDRSPIGYLREPLFPIKELVKIVVVGFCDNLAHFEDASREGNNAQITLEYTYDLR